MADVTVGVALKWRPPCAVGAGCESTHLAPSIASRAQRTELQRCRQPHERTGPQDTPQAVA
jgi:hypothetical protein